MDENTDLLSVCLVLIVSDSCLFPEVTKSDLGSSKLSFLKLLLDSLDFFSMKTTPLSLNSFSKKASVIYFVTTPLFNDFFLFDCCY